jgi:glycosyltransferase involved in cell wall biosynthesis
MQDTAIKWPKITIVTPSFNQGHYIEKTILSVLDQNYPNLEYIIIDGGSTDNSVEIIKKYETQLAYWVSEKDKGQSHAINKGLQRATGDIFNWLCSDDYLEEGSLEHIAEAFLKNKNIHCYAGGLRQFSLSGKTLWLYENMLMPDWEDTIRLRLVKQPAVYFSMKAIAQMGPLNESLHYSMDAEWLYKFFFLFKEENVLEDNTIIAHYLLHNNSKSGSQVAGFIKESDSIYRFFSKNKGLTSYVTLLELNELNKNYTFDENILAAVDKQLIERIVFYYLLRKSTKIFSEQDFVFAKQFLSLKEPNINFKPDEIRMMNFLSRYVKNSSWLFFKLKRAYLWRIKKIHLSLDEFDRM